MTDNELTDSRRSYNAFCAGDDRAAFQFANTAASNGDAWGWYYLGLFHRQGKGCERDDGKAEIYLERAVLMGCDAALVSLGRCYAARGDMDRAFWTFSKAADKGYVRGQYWLGRAYMNGSGIHLDLAKAERLLLQASKGGHAGAQLDLSSARAKGKYGVMHVLPGIFGIVKGFYMLLKGLRANLHANLLG